MLLDMHCHILPGVDDGSRDRTTSLAMLREARRAGVTDLVATPHLLHLPVKDMTAEREWLTREAEAVGIRLRCAYEVNWRMLFECPLEQLTEYRIPGTELMLLELGERELFPQWESTISRLTKILWPVIVHPERTVPFQKDPELLLGLKRMGCMVQVDAESFGMGLFSKERKLARRLLESGDADAVGSDAHNSRGYVDFVDCYEKYSAIWPRTVESYFMR